jgi:iron complex outermembrane receptor protein
LILPVPDRVGQLHLSATYAYSTDYTVASPEATPYGVMGATRLLNLNLNWNSIFGSGIDAALFATNVTDYHYSTFAPGVFDALGVEVRSLGEPRMYGARVRWNFGR